MTTALIVLALILTLTGIIGCVFPGLPGHPLNYLAMWCVQWAFHPFSTSTLIVFGILTIVVLVLDYYVPIWTAKKFGATKQGIIGSMLGMIIGFFFTPIGMILGTILGAIMGDMIAGKSSTQATKSGLATFLGTLISIGMKLVLSGVMTGIVIYKITSQLIN